MEEFATVEVAEERGGVLGQLDELALHLVHVLWGEGACQLVGWSNFTRDNFHYFVDIMGDWRVNERTALN